MRFGIVVAIEQLNDVTFKYNIILLHSNNIIIGQNKVIFE